MTADGAATGVGPLIALVAMWWIMMGLMMLPVSVPWFRTLHRLGDGFPASTKFGIGYLGVWLGFSIGAALLQTALARQELFGGGVAAPTVTVALLVLAGAYQLSPAKKTCLRHCRSPMSFFLTKWHNGPRRTLRLGLEHGLFCLGCCWALMLLALGLGTMSLWGMAALMGIVATENLLRRGAAFSVWIGIGLIGLGVAGAILA